MAARTVQTEIGEVQFEDDMPISALQAVMGGASDGSLDKIIEGMTQIVLAWPFEGAPSDTAAWGALRRSQFNVIILAVTSSLAETGKE